jgi:NADH:ubiquinone oxidoreductase subunit 2 (subunit N)
LSKRHTVLAAVVTVILFSLAGVPPLAGFFAKLFVLLAAMSNNLYSLSFAAIIFSCFSAFYYIRIVKVIFAEKPKDSTFTSIASNSLVSNKVYSYSFDKGVTYSFSLITCFLVVFVFSFSDAFDAMLCL